MPSKKLREEKIRTVTPSGRKDESFFEAVFDLVRQVPRGRVTSYGAIAAALGARSSARMVGWAMNGSHRVKPSVPAHRVVNREGLLTGKVHFNPPEKMQQLLEKEGVKVVDNQVQDFLKKFWDPMKELGLDS
ncbi:MAG TPA: MGMT family protein [Flavisolibacter sp.]|jgi:methylated-DNA-protein-cysteine methyltransferase-like protein